MLRIIELFAGVGSQHQALKNLNIPHEVVAISEIDKYAVKSYEALHGKANNLGDITKIVELPKADLWTYSFPCQDISVAGKQAGLDKGLGTRSGLLWEVERLLLQAKDTNTLPKYLLMENVKNLVGKTHKPNFEKWIAFLNSLGYWTYWKVLNAKDYGVPQNRERVFAVSILGKGYYKFPKKTLLTTRIKHVKEDKVDEKYYLSEKLIKGFRLKESKKPTFKFEPKTEKDIACCLTSRYFKMGISDNYIAEPQCEVVGSLDTAHEQQARVYSPNGISPTLDTMQGGGREPKILTKDRIRRLTPKECWRLMGWKDEQINKIADCGMSDTQMYRQAGNGIVVLVLEAIFRNLFLTETQEHEIDTSNYIEVNQICL